MTTWALLLGMVTVIDVTMLGALVQVAGGVPDSSFLVIVSRYLKKKGEPPHMVLHPREAASRLARARKKANRITGGAAAAAAALSLAAVFRGWGVVAMLAVTVWLLAGNLAFASTVISIWQRRAGRMKEDVVLEASGRAAAGPPREGGPEEAGGGGTDDRSRSAD